MIQSVAKIRADLLDTSNFKPRIRFSTGCTLVDFVVSGVPGCFGFQAGKFVNICGDKSAGKTILAMQTIAEGVLKYKDKFRFIYDDAESGNTFDSISMFGFSMEDRTVQSDTVERAFYNIRKFCESLKEDELGIYVLDGLDALTSKEQDDLADERIRAFDNDKEFDKGSYGMSKQKFLSNTFFPQLAGVVEKKNVLVIIISQIRENIDMFSFEKYRRSGGKALDFYANAVVWLATQKKIMKKDRYVGVVVKAKTTKLKAPRPFRECSFSILFDYGIDDLGSCLDYIFELRTEQGELKSKRDKIEWKGVEYTRDKLIEKIEQDNEEQELTNMTIEKWERLEQSIHSNRKKRYATQPQEVIDA